MKRILTGCAALLMLWLLPVGSPAAAGWAEGLFIQQQEELQDSLVAPETTLQRPLQVLVDGNAAGLTDTVLGQESLSVQVTAGQHLFETVRIEKQQGVYTLVVQTKGGIAVPQQAELTLRRSLHGEEQAVCHLTFRVGYALADSDLLDGLAKGEAIPVDGQRPTYSAKQLAELLQKNGGEPLTFAAEGWTLQGLPNANRDLCLLYNTETIGAVESRLQQEGRELVYLNFPAGVQLAQKGVLTLDVSHLEGFGETFYVYRYAYGRLYRYPAQYSGGSLTIPTGVLDHFVLTNRPVAEGTVVGSQPDHTHKNPDTGDNTVVGTAAVLAAAALVVAGVVCLKKRG